MSNPLFSVIIPAYNSEGYIRKALDSIACQTFRDFELIVICDSCNDSTEEIAKSYGAITKTVQYHTDGLTRDEGVQMASGEWLMFMDDDDWWLHEHVLQQLSEVVGKNDEDVLAFGYIHKAYGYIRQSMDAINDDVCINVWAKCFRRSAINGARFGNYKYCSDRFFLRHVYKSIRRIAFWDMPIYYYNWMRTGSQTQRLNMGRMTGVSIPWDINVYEPEVE